MSFRPVATAKKLSFKNLYFCSLLFCAYKHLYLKEIFFLVELLNEYFSNLHLTLVIGALICNFISKLIWIDL